MRLSPLDHMFAGKHAAVNLSVRYLSPLEGTDRVVDGLKNLSSELITLRGTLKRVDDSTLAFVDGGPGPQYSHIHLNSLPPPEDSESILRLVDLVKSVPDEPLLRVRLIEAPEGKILAISISHTSVDGMGMARLFQELAGRLQGKSPMKLVEDRTPLLPTGPLPPPSLTSADFLERTGALWTPDFKRASPMSGRFVRRFIPSEELDRATRRLQADAGNLEFTMNDVICAYLMHEKFRSLPHPPAAMNCVMAYNIRGQIAGILGSYLGNAIGAIAASIPRAELEQESLLPVVLRLQAAQRRISRENSYASIAVLESTRRARGLRMLDEIGTPDTSLVTRISNVSAAFAMAGKSAEHQVRLSLSTLQDLLLVYPFANNEIPGVIVQSFHGGS